MNDSPPQQEFVQPGETPHEPSDVDARGVGLFVVLMVAGILATVFGLAALFTVFQATADDRDPGRSARQEERGEPPAPRLQVAPSHDLQSLVAQQEELLDRLEWIDRPAGIVRIPLEKALEIVAQDGVPQWPAADDPSPAVPGNHDDSKETR